jgi:ATP-dependent helicase/DNAse subunit B
MDNVGCKYCKYKDICGVESKDYRIIDLKESEEE